MAVASMVRSLGCRHCSTSLSAILGNAHPARTLTTETQSEHTASEEATGSQEHTQGAIKSSKRSQLVDRLLRRSHAAEVAAQGFFRGQCLAGRGRADLSYFNEQEQQALDQAKGLLPRFRARPSILQDALKLGGLATGLVAGLAPRPLQLAIWGAVSEMMEEQHTDALRDVLEAAAEHKLDPEQAEALREALRRLRDVERAPHGAPPAPDIMMLQSLERMEQLGMGGVAALVVKLAGKAALGVVSRV